jgi:hypothetical protein
MAKLVALKSGEWIFSIGNGSFYFFLTVFDLVQRYRYMEFDKGDVVEDFFGVIVFMHNDVGHTDGCK